MFHDVLLIRLDPASDIRRYSVYVASLRLANTLNQCMNRRTNECEAIRITTNHLTAIVLAQEYHTDRITLLKVCSELFIYYLFY